MKVFINLVFLISFFSFSQEKIIGKAKYSKEIILKFKKKNDKYSNFKSKLQKKLVTDCENLTYTLTFKGYESVFKLDSDLSLDDKGVKLASRIFGGKGVYYTNLLTKKKLHAKESFGGSHFIVQSNLDSLSWKLLNEKKMIGKFVCYKGTSTKLINTNKKIVKKNIIAWYCPSIPANFGPIGYGNLPGLILELKIENEVIFKLKSIKLSPKNINKIIKPSKGKLVSEKEFNEIGREMYLKRKEGF